MGDFFVPQMGDALTEGVCFDTSLARGEWGIAKPTIPHSLRRSAWASRTTAAPVGRFPLLAVLVYVADEHPADYARVGAQTLKAGVVRLYSVVVILGGGVR
ncbi:MAG TPA: hypothetical protein VI055_11420 [Rubrobacter sp.]|jgi:hypothetical protein